MKTLKKAVLAILVFIFGFLATLVENWMLTVRRGEMEARLASDHYGWVEVITLAKPELPNHPPPYGRYEVGFTITYPAGYYMVFYDHNLQAQVWTQGDQWKRVEIR